MNTYDQLDQPHDERSTENVMLNLQERVVFKSEIMVAAEWLIHVEVQIFLTVPGY
jgi:hypothetical protein